MNSEPTSQSITTLVAVQITAGLLLTAVAFPWVSPLSWGPNPDMLQHLATGGSVAVLLLAAALGGHLLSRSALVGTVAWGWLLAALLSAGMAVVQYFGVADAAWSEWVMRTDIGTAYANLRQRNQFASLTSIGLLSLLWLAHRPPGATPLALPALRTSALCVAVALLAVGNACSSSRTGALQWLLIAVLAWWWGRGEQRTALRWSGLALGLYLVANLVLPLALQALTGQVPANALERFGEDAGSQSRTVLWANVIELTRVHPWLGWGWGELKFAHFMHPYAGERFSVILDNAHNLPLHLAVELGVPAALLLCGGALALALRAKPWQERQPTRQLAWGVLLVIALHSVLEYPLWYGPFQVAAVLAICMLCSERLLQWRGLRLAACAVAGVLIAMTAYTGWDYARVSQLYLPPQFRAERWKENTYDKVKDSVLFRNSVQFAYVTTTPVTPETARALYTASWQVLHYSPEPKVIAVLLESAALLNLESPLTEHIRRQWRVAYPEGY
ncbi:O-antigen ligase family protein [Rhodoferax sp.]|uniref:PglL family O-oligosaccharyltransferase n=1 Tax=Rhodoferax sp. TaxID=50421 RepID=UPI0025D90B63|nr:O-antigen ligase family protein [Rhodoferax sp.]